MQRPVQWAEQIPDYEWRVYAAVLRAIRERGIPFALGGAFALASYTSRWRDTKDLDIYILPEHRETMIELLTNAGLKDYYHCLPYQRHWIYRAYSGETIVDAIWAMANHRADVDERWLTRGAVVCIRGHRLRVIPPEEMVWDKMYIVQRDRCDWPDVFNLVRATRDTLDWEYLLDRVGIDWPVLAGVLSVFRWVAPGVAPMVPASVWSRLRLPQPQANGVPPVDCRAVSLLDTRPWFREEGTCSLAP